MKRQTVWTMKYLFVAATLVAALASTQSVWAVTDVCVGSNDELAVALVEAQYIPVKIEIIQGTYSIANTIWYNSLSKVAMQPGTSLRGGYTANCLGRDIASGNTILGSNSAIVANFYVLGDFTIEGLTLRLTNGMIIYADSSYGGYDIAPSTELLIRRSEIASSGFLPMTIEWNQDDDIGGQIRIEDTLAHDNSGECTFEFDVPHGSPVITLINNTIVNNDNSRGGACMENRLGIDDGNGSLFAYNNIFYGNGGHDLYSDSSALVLVDNVIGTHSYPTPITPPTGTLTGNPKLDPTTYRPIESPPSPVINSGTADVAGGLPSTDHSGRDRVFGNAPDRGAFESLINDSVFQPVTSTGDSGPNTLRAAILNANANGTSGAIITFNLGSNCNDPYVITLQTPLPDILQETHILGYSQRGSSPNDLNEGDDATICLILDGSAHAIADGLTVSPNAADTIKVAVVGLAFSGFSHAAINLRGGSGHTVNGVHIGGSVGGVGLDPVGYGIIIGPGVHDVTVGGDYQDYGLRNIIGEAINNGIHIDGSSGSTGAAHDNQILSNYIGVGWNNVGLGSFVNRGNMLGGVAVAGYNNRIQSNFIEYNAARGVHLTGTDAHDNTVTLNAIGYLATLTDAGNGTGVLVDDSSHDNTIEGNDIWYNIGAGLRVVSGKHNSATQNQFYGNGALGIDLAAAGVTLNDNDSALQPDDYANRGQNFPVLTDAIGGHVKGSVSGTLTSTPGIYGLEFYSSSGCDASGYGQGNFAIGRSQVVIPPTGPIGDGQNSVSFTLPLNGFFLNGFTTITALATDASGDTSEFSQCVTYTDDTIFADDFE